MRRKIRDGLCVLTNISIVILLIMSLIPNKIGMNENLSVDKLVTDFSYNYIEVEKFVDEELVNNVINDVVQPVKEIQPIMVEEKKISPSIENTSPVITTYYGRMTAYGPDCNGCNGITASEYDVRNNFTYYDSVYGEISIVAGDSRLLYSIVRIVVPGESPILAIVLDTGGSIGFNKSIMFDLLFESEAVAADYGTRSNVKFELLRNGN